MEVNPLIEGPIGTPFISERIGNHSGSHDAGALALFLGQVRSDRVDSRTVESIEYSAYAEMVAPVVESVIADLSGRYPDLICLEIWHSTGVVKAGEISLFVLAAAGHRKQSFRVLEECVEQIKEKLPVWKKEHFTDGSSRWVE